MKRNILFTILILITTDVFPQLYHLDWLKSNGEIRISHVNTSIIANDSTIIVVAMGSDADYNTSGDMDTWIFKVNFNGEIIWRKCLASYNNAKTIYSIKELKDHSYFLSGYTFASGTMNPTMWLIKIDNDGNIIKDTTIFSHSSIAYYSNVTNDGGYIITGFFSDTTYQGYHFKSNTYNIYDDAVVIKTDSNFNIQWDKCYGGSAADGGMFIEQTRDSGFLMIGTSSSLDGDVIDQHGPGEYLTDIWVVKLDKNGKMLSQNCIGGSYMELVSTVLKTQDKGYLIIGSTSSDDGDISLSHKNNNHFFDYLIIKLDSLGNKQWVRSYGGFSTDYGYSGYQLKNGNYLILGYDDSGGDYVFGNHGYADCWLLEIDSNGNMVRNQCFGSNLNDYGSSIQPVNDKDFIIFGTTHASTIIDGAGLNNLVFMAKIMPCYSNYIEMDTTICTNGTPLTDYQYQYSGDYSQFDCKPITLTKVFNQHCNPTMIINNTTNSDEIFPNPVNSILNINVENFKYAELFDLNGLMVSSYNKNSIDISNYPKGIYILRVHKRNGDLKIYKCLFQ